MYGKEEKNTFIRPDAQPFLWQGLEKIGFDEMEKFIE